MRKIFFKIVFWFLSALFFLGDSFVLANEKLHLDENNVREAPPRYEYIKLKDKAAPRLNLSNVKDLHEPEISKDKDKKISSNYLKKSNSNSKDIISTTEDISFIDNDIKNDDVDLIIPKTNMVAPRIHSYVLSIDKTFDVSINEYIGSVNENQSELDKISVPRIYNSALPDAISVEEEKKIEALVAKEQDIPDWKEFLLWLKGQPADDAVNLGMFSLHTSASDFNAVNNMISLQYGGVSAGYFRNSWFDDTYFVAVARKVWEKKFTKDFSMNLQYKAGIMHGYGENAPVRIGPIEPVILPLIGFTFKKVGFDLWVVPSSHPIFATNFRLDLPEAMTFKSLKSKYRDKKLADKFGKSFAIQNTTSVIEKSSPKDEKSLINYTPIVPIIMNDRF